MTPDYRRIFEEGERAFREDEAFDGNLAEACFRSLHRWGGKKILVDRTAARREMSAGKLLAVSTVLSRSWAKSIPGRRVGIVFPPGLGAWITNLAVIFCGKIPVNLNFTTGKLSLQASIRQAEISTVITAEAVQDRFPDFPWLEDTRDLISELKGLSKLRMVAMMVAVRCLPCGLLVRLLDIPCVGGDEEAGLLFSSGSTGQPKGVVLTHRNLLGNLQQIADCELLPASETLLACLPIFHSFGFTVTMWYTLVMGLRVVTVPSPLETRKIASAAREEKATVLVGTPTFFRGYLRRIKPEDFRSLKQVYAGAEKTPEGLAESWEARFDTLYLEGYGLTETSPVVSCNLPSEFHNDRTGRREPARRIGSVGRLFPGIAARIVNPDTGREQPLAETGMLHLKGVNIFPGYLAASETAEEVFEDGWFVTGDLARIDEDGFLFIEGRLSRFSKIGGEMAPHGAIEEQIARLFGLEESDRPMVAVAGVADEKKGESLVLLSAAEFTMEALRGRFRESGLPNLWMPRRVVRVEEIPCLASGKLDLRKLRELAEGD